ncbi:MAG TPA: AMP-dependent synthetase/ligase, partial [Conexibacter sp.]|nr:AMP-dependent synthetase/ligase [Conexibacter sp.]
IAMAGAVVVPIYPTNSPQECAWVLGDSEAVAVICEDAAQAAKVAAVRERLPRLRDVVTIEPAAGLTDVATLRERGWARIGGREELEARWRAVAPDDLFTIVYTSGTTGPPKGCLLDHGGYRAGIDMVRARDVFEGERDLIYLFLPLAHSFALLIQLAGCDAGAAIAYFGGDTSRVVAELAECRPTYLPAVPRIFEKLHRRVCADVEPATLRRATAIGGEVERLRRAGASVPPVLQAQYDRFDATLFARVRAAFGGRLRQAATGAAPIAPEILEFFWACGVPVMEGYGMTETATAVTASSPGDHRFGTVGRAVPGAQLRLAADGELLVRSPSLFRGYHGRADATAEALVDGWLKTGDLAAIDADGWVTITGRKKEIIITAGGKNLSPANIENELKQCRWVAQAVMHGDRRPYPVMLVTLDPEEIVPWARAQGLDGDLAALAREPRVHALVQAALDRVNARYAPVEQVKKFFVLERELSQRHGELTASAKVRRAAVDALHAERFDALYAR